ncbi:hypothetical protein [Pseudomonas plecoglossicida]|uniref:hypothetical protein n=1 Tax=Pseudomonas plecoglossicida TaxID=70775 RepID=UPI0015E39D0A|nr:hypothetical protein [Pseudomonas plecoglossicida]MBA1321223.1 hypothetical protein [Pseudomonas plecoglossicida]
MREKINRYFVNFWFFAISLVVVSVVLAIYLYRLNIGVEFSRNPNDWSGFGSYFGGIIGPVVSFVTLLAVLKTVYLQREMLRAQSEEFERINIIQQDQLDGASRQALLLQIASAQDSALKVIELQVAVQEREFDRQNEMVFKIQDMFGLDMNSSNIEKLKEHVRQRNRARKLVDWLSSLALDLQLQEFDSVANVRNFLKEKLETIHVKVTELFPREERA